MLVGITELEWWTVEYTIFADGISLTSTLGMLIDEIKTGWSREHTVMVPGIIFQDKSMLQVKN